MKIVKPALSTRARFAAVVTALATAAGIGGHIGHGLGMEAAKPGMSLQMQEHVIAEIDALARAYWALYMEGEYKGTAAQRQTFAEAMQGWQWTQAEQHASAGGISALPTYGAIASADALNEALLHNERVQAKAAADEREAERLHNEDIVAFYKYHDASAWTDKYIPSTYSYEPPSDEAREYYEWTKKHDPHYVRDRMKDIKAAHPESWPPPLPPLPPQFRTHQFTRPEERYLAIAHPDNVMQTLHDGYEDYDYNALATRVTVR